MEEYTASKNQSNVEADMISSDALWKGFSSF